MNAGRRTWLSVAAVAAVFSFIVLAVMLGYYSRQLGENPLDTAEWVEVKTEMQGRPTDQALAGRIRDLDLDLRRGFFLRQASSPARR